MVGRIAGALVLALAVVGLVGAVTFAGQPNDSVGSENGCRGITNAYAHAADAALPALQAVADKLGCDLSGVERVAKPVPDKPDKATDEDTDADEQAETDGEDADAEDDSGTGPDVQAKCDKIAAKLVVAQARPHGKSADAFARQAEHWGCDSN